MGKDITTCKYCREFDKKTVTVLGIERFMKLLHKGGYESIGILVSQEDGEGIKRGDVFVGAKEDSNE